MSTNMVGKFSNDKFFRVALIALRFSTMAEEIFKYRYSQVSYLTLRRFRKFLNISTLKSFKFIGRLTKNPFGHLVSTNSLIKNP